MAEQTSQPVQVQKGNTVVDIDFDVTGSKKDGTKFEIKGFQARLVFKDHKDLVDNATKSGKIAVMNTIRIAARDGKALPFMPGKRVTVNSSGSLSLTPEELNQQAIERVLSNPDVLKSATPEQRAKFAALFGLSIPEDAPPVDEPEQSTEETSDDSPKFNKAELEGLSMRKLKEIALKEGLDTEGLDKPAIIAELAQL